MRIDTFRLDAKTPLFKIVRPIYEKQRGQWVETGEENEVVVYYWGESPEEAYRNLFADYNQDYLRFVVDHCLFLVHTPVTVMAKAMVITHSDVAQFGLNLPREKLPTDQRHDEFAIRRRMGMRLAGLVLDACHKDYHLITTGYPLPGEEEE